MEAGAGGGLDCIQQLAELLHNSWVAQGLLLKQMPHDDHCLRRNLLNFAVDHSQQVRKASISHLRDIVGYPSQGLGE